MKEKYLLLGLVLMTILTRVFFLADFPKGFSGDEVQQGYSAYSILKTGKDEWGQFLPLSPRGFGDFKPPLYTFITVPSIAIFGLNEHAVRFPAALMGVLTVILVYFLAKQLFQNGQLSLLAAFLLAINPWHIQISRTAFEGGLGVLLFCAGLLFFLKGLNNSKLFIYSAIFWGLTLYTYHSFRLFLALLLVFIIFAFREKINFKKLIAPTIIFIVCLLPLLFNIKSTLVRSSDVGIFSNQQISGYFKNKGTSPLPPLFDKAFDNKFIYLTGVFYENFLSYYSPQFLFTGNRSDGSYLNFPGYPLLYPFEILSIYLGIYLLVKGKEKKLIFGWLILAAIPAAIATGSMSAHRAVTFLPLLSIISALGFKSIIDSLSDKLNINKKKLYQITIFILLVSFINFLYYYLIKLPKHIPESLRPEYKQIFQETLSLQSKFDAVVMSKAFSQPQIFLAFYSQFDPVEYQKASQDWLRYEKSDKLYIDQLESWNLGKFYFEDLNWKAKESKRINALIIARASDFPEDVETTYEVKNKRGEVTYKFVPVNHAK